MKTVLGRVSALRLDVEHFGPNGMTKVTASSIWFLRMLTPSVGALRIDTALISLKKVLRNSANPDSHGGCASSGPPSRRRQVLVGAIISFKRTIGRHPLPSDCLHSPPRSPPHKYRLHARPSLWVIYLLSSGTGASAIARRTRAAFRALCRMGDGSSLMSGVARWGARKFIHDAPSTEPG